MYIYVYTHTEILTGQLTFYFPIYNHCRADFWECLHSGSVSHLTSWRRVRYTLPAHGLHCPHASMPKLPSYRCCIAAESWRQYCPPRPRWWHTPHTRLTEWMLWGCEFAGSCGQKVPINIPPFFLAPLTHTYTHTLASLGSCCETLKESIITGVVANKSL